MLTWCNYGKAPARLSQHRNGLTFVVSHRPIPDGLAHPRLSNAQLRRPSPIDRTSLHFGFSDDAIIYQIWRRQVLSSLGGPALLDHSIRESRRPPAAWFANPQNSMMDSV